MMNSARTLLLCALAAPVAAQAQVQPGQWETTSTIHSVEMPGAPPQVAQMMKGKTTRTRYCVTPEQAAKGPQDMFKQNSSCRFTKFVMKGGTLATEMTCSQQGGAMTVRTNGSYTPTSYQAAATMVMSGQMGMRMSSSATGRLLGPCKDR